MKYDIIIYSLQSGCHIWDADLSGTRTYQLLNFARIRANPLLIVNELGDAFRIVGRNRAGDKGNI